MATYNEPMRPYEFVLSDHGGISYESVTLNSGSGTIVAGSVLGRITKRQASAAIPTIVGTGTSAMSALTFGPDVQVGNYTITATSTSATSVLTVVAPDGTALPNGAVGTTYKSSHIGFLVTDASTTAGDYFTLAVAAGGTPASAGGNGNSAMSAITLGKFAQRGAYKVVCTSTGSHTATYAVIAPDGQPVLNTVDGLMGYASSGGADAFVSDHVNFTITDGSTDNVVGTYFNIIVAGYSAPEGLLWDPTAVNGVNEVFGIATHGAAASGTVAVLTRLAEVKTAALTWKSTVTAAQKTEAYRQMAANNLIVRS